MEGVAVVPAPPAANGNRCAVPLPVLFRLVCGIIARSAGLFQNPKQICACDGVTLWEERDRPIAGKGRSKASVDVPAANLWRPSTGVMTKGKWPYCPWMCLCVCFHCFQMHLSSHLYVLGCALVLLHSNESKPAILCSVKCMLFMF